MSNINIERIYGISNLFAFMFFLIALGAAFMHEEISLWLPLAILATPTVLFGVVILGALAWSFYITRKNNVK